jgi:hypothetical protein
LGRYEIRSDGNVFHERLAVKLRHHNLDIVPIGEFIAWNTHRSHFAMVAKLGKSFVGELVNKSDGRFFRSGRRLGHLIGIVGLKGEFLAYLISRKLGVRSVAERLVGALLAIAEVGVTAFFGGESLGREIGTFVGSVAEGLVG